MNFRVLYNNVLIRRDKKLTVKNGILIPDTAEEEHFTGTVLKVGKGLQLKDGTFTGMQVKEGDRVLFSGYGYNVITVDEEDLYLMKEVEILGIIE